MESLERTWGDAPEILNVVRGTSGRERRCSRAEIVRTGVERISEQAHEIEPRRQLEAEHKARNGRVDESRSEAQRTSIATVDAAVLGRGFLSARRGLADGRRMIRKVDIHMSDQIRSSGGHGEKHHRRQERGDETPEPNQSHEAVHATEKTKIFLARQMKFFPTPPPFEIDRP
jgi:hypothetical protein